ncbi:MAG: LysR family transcriptional regulator, partial [Acidaminococcaceae bacterium]|nr:LysR family transcriptional regulator [Acidaminococcaceae bacterium]
MNSKQIDCILMLAQTLNFNRAAENLYITQPTLTYHIKTA